MLKWFYKWDFEDSNVKVLPKSTSTFVENGRSTVEIISIRPNIYSDISDIKISVLQH